MNRTIYENLLGIFDTHQIKCDEEMKNHTSLNVGGKADFLIEADNESQIVALRKLCYKEKYPFCIIGRGSNLLIRDEGYKGIILKISDAFKGIEVEDDVLKIKSGTSLAEVAKVAYMNELSGLEFASGIPGTVGGAIAMNAGAYGKEMKDVVTSVTLVNDEGKVKRIEASNMQFSYRKSLITGNPSYIVLYAEIKLNKGKKEDIFNEMNEKRLKRCSSQPLDKYNCGSVFKRPINEFAGKLIEDCGLKGYIYNGVEVSSRHAGFIVNDGCSTATDVLKVIEKVKNEVREKFNIELEEEVKVV